MQAQMVDAPAVKGAANPARERMMRASLDIRFSGGEWLRQFDSPGQGAQGAANRLQLVLLAAPPASSGSSEARDLELVRRITADPAYQLK